MNPWPQVPAHRPAIISRGFGRSRFVPWSAQSMTADAGAVKRRRPIGAAGPRRPRHPRLFRPTTWAAGLILLTTCVVAAAVWSLSSTGASVSGGAVAARVGPSAVTNAQVGSEVDAILAVCRPTGSPSRA